jgi:hypothetical protein
MSKEEINALIAKLRTAVAHMPSHQREREQGKLLVESLKALIELTETKP